MPESMGGSLASQVGAALGSTPTWGLIKPARSKRFFSVWFKPCLSQGEAPSLGC